MFYLHNTLNAFGSSEFNNILKTEVEALNSDQLPLQQGLTRSSYAVDTHLKIMIINVNDDHQFIHAKVGIFYAGIIAGCSCADDPTPVEEQSEYCIVQLVINKQTAATTAQLVEA